MINGFRQALNALPSLFALHDFALWVDRVDTPVPAGAPQVGKRATGGLRRIVGSPDDGKALRRKQCAMQMFWRRQARAR